MDGLRHAPSWNIKVEWWLEAYAPALEAPRNLKAGRRRGGPRRKGCGDRTGLWQTPPAFRRSPNYISRPRRHHTQSACCDCPTYLGFRVKRPASSSYSRRVDRGRERRLGASADGCITRGCSTGRRRRVDEPVLGGAQGVLASSAVWCAWSSTQDQPVNVVHVGVVGVGFLPSLWSPAVFLAFRLTGKTDLVKPRACSRSVSTSQVSPPSKAAPRRSGTYVRGLIGGM